MPELTKLDAKIAIESKLTEIKSILTDLDKLTSKAESLELEMDKLKAQEAAILADTSRDDDAKLPELLAVRAKVDLKSAAIASLRGVKAAANNVDSAKGKIEVVEEIVEAVGTVVGQLFKAFNDAVIVAFKEHTIEATRFFVQEEDRPVLDQLRHRHPLYREMNAFVPPHFGKDHIRGHADSISNARNLEPVWSRLKENAEGYSDLEVSVHDAWLE
jgi:hypothetical protein